MKIKVKNFRCYSESECDFGNSGLTLISGPSGKGKCLAKDTPILMFDGSIRKVQDIKPCDKIMGEKSSPKFVSSVTSGYDEMFTIKPKLGNSYTVNSSHILTLKNRAPILKENTVYYINNGKKIKKTFHLLNEASSFFEKVKSRLTFDISISDYIKQFGTNYNKNIYTYHAKVFFPKTKIPIPIPNFVKLLYNYPDIIKQIPNTYKCNSYKRRVSLLKELCARFAVYEENQIRIVHDNTTIVKDIEYIALSLGFATKIIKSPSILSSDENYDMLTITGDLSLLHHKYTQNKDFIFEQPFKIEHIGKGEYYGFELDSKDKRFLLGDFTVTHNTSLMMAINFALFGTGTKITSIGKTSCRVDLEFNDLSISRSKRPNKLILNRNGDSYEDDVAQSIIDNYFGKSFQITSYIQQNAINSFILMGPTEKLQFLENIIFANIDISKIKEICNQNIKRNNEILISTTAELELLTKQLGEIKKLDKVQFPLPIEKNKKSTIKKYIENYNILKETIKNNTETLTKLRNEFADLRVFNTNRDNIVDDINRQKQKLYSLNSRLQTINYIGDNELLQLNKKLLSLRESKEIKNTIDKYENDLIRLKQLQEKEMEDMIREKSDILETVWKEYDKSEIDDIIKTCQETAKDTERIEIITKQMGTMKIKSDDELLSLNKQIEEKKNSIDILSRKIVICPSCNKTLSYHNNQLFICDNNTTNDDDITLLTNLLSRLELDMSNSKSMKNKYTDLQSEVNMIKDKYEELTTKAEAEADLEYVKDYKRRNIEMENKKERLENKIKNKIYSSTLSSLERDLNKRKQIIETYPSVNYDHNEENELQIKVSTETLNKTKVNELNKQIKEISRDITNSENHLNSLLSKNNIPIEELEHEIKELSQQIEGKIKTIEDSENKIKEIEEYQRYKKDQLHYKKHKKQIKEVKTRENEYKDRYSASLIFKEKILQSEAITIANIIDSINVYAQEYLDLFFPNEPIIVRLLPFKDFKDNKKISKPQINIQVDYRGIESDISILSGGEISRVILAFTLALSEIFNSPLILLDECTASLDQETTSTVINAIRKNFSNRLVLVIAHQVISGDFDKTINLD